MVLYSPIAQLPYPALSDSPNAQSAGQQLTTALDGITLPKFSSDSAVSAAIPSPQNGQCIMRTDVGLGTIMRYSSGSGRWIADNALIAEQTITVTTTFSSIPQYWNHLQVIVSGIKTTDAVEYIFGSLTLNGDNSSGHYNYMYMTWTIGSSPPNNNAVSNTGANYNSTAFVYTGSSVFSSSSIGSYADILIPGYSNTGTRKAGRCTSYASDGGTAGESCTNFWSYGVATSITSVTIGFGGHNVTGAKVSLYGLA
jgi:hypothetical protein